MNYLLEGGGGPRAELVQVLPEEPRKGGLARARVAEEGKVERDGDALLLGHAALGVHLAVQQQRLVFHLGAWTRQNIIRGGDEGDLEAIVQVDKRPERAPVALKKRRPQ